MTRCPAARRRALVALALAVVLAVPAVARAAGVVGDGGLESCTDAAFDAALAGGGLVTFDCGGVATIEVRTTKRIEIDTTIDGRGLVSLSGGGRTRVLEVAPAVGLTLRDLAIVDGNSGLDPGGAVRNLGRLEVERCLIAAGRTQGFGGGIANEGDGRVIDSTFADNAAWVGGGIANFRDLEVRGTLFFHNVVAHLSEGGNGGGIANYGRLLAVNSTFSRNEAWSTGTPYSTGYGGAIDNEGEAMVANCTLTRNGVNDGFRPSACGGLHNNGVMTLRNSLVAHSIGNDCCTGPDGRSVDSGANLTDDGSTFCNGFRRVAPDALGIHGLADNGGPTLTVALTAASAALDAGDPATCADPTLAGGLDQRGAARFAAGDAACDVGAFELPYAATPRPTPTPAVTFLDMEGDVDEYISLGRRWTYDSRETRFVAAHAGGEVRIDLRGDTFWTLFFSAPRGTELTPGDYDGASGDGENRTRPGLSIGGDGRGCNRITGRFTVREAVFAVDGTVEHFAADFVQHCEGGPRALRGSLRIRSNAAAASPGVYTPTPTPSPSPRPCHGDCGGDGRVSIDELVRGVTLALAAAGPGTCAPLDADGDGLIGIGDLIAAVAAAVGGCG